MNHPLKLLELLRPFQWKKNAFVFTGILFANAWTNISLLLNVITVAAAFCCISSSVYIFNDIFDREKDRQHPKKRLRPIAAGDVSIPYAIVLAILLLIASLALSLWVSPKACIIIGGYALLNVAYSIRLKDVVILDVFCIAAGFMLRILAGTSGVGIPPSKWLLMCGLMITLFLGFAKRRAELMTLEPQKHHKQRYVLKNYSPVLLDEISAICATGTILTYSLYTMSPDTIHIHQTESLMYTVPFVIYGLFRYIFILHHFQAGQEPSRDILKDKHIVASVIGWFLITLWIFSH